MGRKRDERMAARKATKNKAATGYKPAGDTLSANASTASLPATNPNGSTGPKGIPIERLIDWQAKKLTIREMAKLAECSETNVQKRLASLDLENLDTFNTHKAKMYDLVERQKLEKLINGDSTKEMADMTIAAIAGDKGRVIRGQATEIVDHRHLVIDLSAAVQRLREEQKVDTKYPDVIEVMDCPTAK
jgi:hypothetical protein